MFLKIKFYSSLLLVLIYFSLFVNCVYAETHIKAGDLDRGGNWNNNGSPYIIDEDVYVPSGYKLIINGDVTVMSASSTDDNPELRGITLDGDMIVRGSESIVKFDTLSGVYLTHSNIEISNSIFNRTSLSLWQSTSTIVNSFFTNSNEAISARGSSIKIDKSKIIGNKIGIASYYLPESPVLIFEKFGIKTAMANDDDKIVYGLDQRQNQISISDSIIEDNKKYGVINYIDNMIDARDIWWGSEIGPRMYVTGEGDRISGNIDYKPWKTKDPLMIVCCSNVLFIPGIEASRLYMTSFGVLGTSTNTLWEPNRNADVEKLFLDQSGKSLNEGIYTSDIIDSAYNLKKIYKSFVTMMNGVVAERYINEWLPFPYDWRMGVDSVVYNRTKVSSTTISLIETLEKLSKSSMNGKVTIIAHSNGGLVSKILIKALQDSGIINLIDSVILVASPELGTSQALLALLHGYKQSIFGGAFLNEKTSRNLSINSIGAYGLLPSRKFYENGFVDLIQDSFSSQNTIISNTYDKVKTFLTSNVFSISDKSNTNFPIQLNRNIFKKVENIHSIIDLLSVSSSTKLISYFGWGVPTVLGLKYDNDIHCNKEIKKKCDLSYYPILTNDGDGTVLTKSYSGNSNYLYYFNLDKNNIEQKQSISHSNILESKVMLEEIKRQIISTSSDRINDEYFTTSKPIDDGRRLTIKVYSPIDVHVYDKENNHTGIITNTDQSNSNMYENNIPASYYYDFGKVKVLQVPYNQNYEIILNGSDYGKFTMTAEITQSDKVISSTTFSEIPATPILNAELTISTTTSNIASSTLLMDYTGDGITEFIQNSDEVEKQVPKLYNSRRYFKKKLNRVHTID